MAISPEKIKALGAATKFDICASSASKRKSNDLERIGHPAAAGICHSFTPDGRCVSLFKTLMTNSCLHGCKYCSNSTTCTRKSQPHVYSPQELASLTLSLYKGNYIEGLFLSSGVLKDEVTTMEAMIEAVSLLRNTHRFQGYVHLKLMPGTPEYLIRMAMELADRVSINIETTSASRMSELSETKDYHNDIVAVQRKVHSLSRSMGLPAGQTTQMIVGGAGENDLEIFRAANSQYDSFAMKRVYYSVFCPVSGTPLQNNPHQPLWREHRLYQMDWLLRVYGFSPRVLENVFDENGLLPDSDPKISLARFLLEKPLDVNSASFQELVTVPGIGQVSAKRILAARKREKLISRLQLSNLGVVLKRALPFLRINGLCQATLQGCF